MGQNPQKWSKTAWSTLHGVYCIHVPSYKISQLFGLYMYYVPKIWAPYGAPGHWALGLLS